MQLIINCKPESPILGIAIDTTFIPLQYNPGHVELVAHGTVEGVPLELQDHAI